MKLKLAKLVVGWVAFMVLFAGGKAGAAQTLADLAIYVSASSSSVQMGQQMEISVTLSNGGPATVVGTVTVNAQLPAGFQYVSSMGNGTVIITSTPPNVVWMVWTVVPGAVRNTNEIDITVLATNGGVNTLSATITNLPAGVTDPNLSNNISSVVVTVYSPITMDCPTNPIVPATSSSGATVNFGLLASGGCSLPTVSATPPSGTTFPIGTTPVEIVASDTCGNTNTCSFTVTVVPSSGMLNFASVAINQGGLQLWWLTNVNLVLQQNDSLEPTNWIQVSNTPSMTNGQYLVVIIPTNIHSFYRLAYP